MADSFHRFMDLPLKLRRKVYWNATRPRVVPIKEQIISKTDDEFCKWLRTADLSYIDEKWKPFMEFVMEDMRSDPGIRLAILQMSLEASGVAPRIHMRSFLMQNPKIARAVARESRLYSNAPIPALLHTCPESRAELMRRGYELTFATQSALKPLTWFNFQRDILYFPDTLFSSQLIEETALPPVRPADLKRVERLALWYQGFRRTNRLIRLLEKLKDANESTDKLRELFRVDWTFADIKDWPGITGDCADVDRGIKDLIPVKIEATEYETFPDNMSPHGVPGYFEGDELLADFVHIGTPFSPPSFYEYCCRETKYHMELDYMDFGGVTERWKGITLQIVHMLPQMTLGGLEKRRRSIAEAQHSLYQNQNALCQQREEWRSPSYLWGCEVQEKLYRELSDQDPLVVLAL